MFNTNTLFYFCYFLQLFIWKVEVKTLPAELKIIRLNINLKNDARDMKNALQFSNGVCMYNSDKYTALTADG